MRLPCSPAIPPPAGLGQNWLFYQGNLRLLLTGYIIWP